MIIQAQENSTTWYPQFEERWLPPQVTRDIRVVRTPTKVGIEIGGVVGVVPLLNGDTLQIIPKVGNINFMKMLMVCEGLYGEFQQEFNELATYAHTEDDSISWFVARSFAKALIEINKKSLRFDHKFKVKKGSYASGRIYPVETARRMIQLTEDPIVFGAHERNYSTAENRVLGKAAKIALSLLMEEVNNELLTVVNFWSRRFASNFITGDLLEVDKWFGLRP